MPVIQEQDNADAQAEETRKKINKKLGKREAGPKAVSRQPAKNPRKNNKKASNEDVSAEPMEISESSAMETSELIYFLLRISN